MSNTATTTNTNPAIDCCGSCPNIFSGIRLPDSATTFCGFAIPKSKRYVCADEMRRGDFGKRPIFHNAADFPRKCPAKTPESAGGK